MKTNAIVRIILFSLAILILLGILASVLLFRIFMFNLNESGAIEIVEDVLKVNTSGEISIDGTGRSGTYDADQIRDLEIDWVSGTIIIQAADTEYIHFEESAVTDSKYQLVTKHSGDKLVLQFFEESASKFGFGINTSVDISKDLVITVPRDWACDSLEIDTASARVEVRDLQINEVDFDGASGLCIFENCNIVQLDIDTASGDVEFRGILKELDFDAASANFRGEFLQVPHHLYMDSMSGDLDIALPSYSGFSCKLDVMSGKFTSDFDTSIRNSTYVHGDGACRIEVSAMSGDVSIRKSQ